MGVIGAAVIGAGVAAAGSIAASSISAGAAGKAGQAAQAQQDRLLKEANKIPMENWDVNVSALESQSLSYGLAEAPNINAQNMVQLQSMLDRTMPGWRDMLAKSSANASDLLRGAIPQDVSDLTRRNAAQGALQGGFAGTQAAGNLTARDLGLTSLQLQQTGLSEFQQLLQTTRTYLTPQPVDPTSLLPLNTLVQGSEFQKQGHLSNALAKYTATANAFNVGYQGQQQANAAQASALTGGIGSVSGILSKLVASGALNNAFSGGGGSSAGGVASGLSQSDYNSVIGGGFTNSGLDSEDIAALSAAGYSNSSILNYNQNQQY